MESDKQLTTSEKTDTVKTFFDLWANAQKGRIQLDGRISAIERGADTRPAKSQMDLLMSTQARALELEKHAADDE